MNKQFEYTGVNLKKLLILQYECIERHFRKFHSCKLTNIEEKYLYPNDCFYNFCIHAFQLRDYLKELEIIDQNLITEFYQSEVMRLCRRIANGKKHAILRDKSEREKITKNNQILRFPKTACCFLRELDLQGNLIYVINLYHDAEWHKLDAFNLSEKIIKQIRSFLLEHSLIVNDSS